MFRKLEEIFYEIKNRLLQSGDLKRLVFYNNSDALTRAEPTFEEAEASIYIKPIIYVYEDSPEAGVSSFISIGLIESIALDGSLSSSIKVSVACNREIWEMDNYRVRPLAIISEIVDSLDNTKLQAAGKLVFRIAKEIYFNNDLVGYTLLFDIDEEKGGVVNEF